jgi:hypothetical protein
VARSATHRAPAFAYQRQVELIMNAPREDTRAGVRRERLAAAAVLLAIAVSVLGAFIVIVESSSESSPKHASAGTGTSRATLENGEQHAR